MRRILVPQGRNTVARGFNPSRRAGATTLALLLLLTACSPTDPTADLPTTLTPEETGWPRQFAAEGTAVTLYQPQVESWVQYTSITFRAAVSFTPEGSAEPVFGALRVHADTDTDLENRKVLLGNLEITGSKFLTLDDEASAEWTERIAGLLPPSPMTVDLDRILAYFEHTDAEAVAAELGVEAPAARRSEVAHDAPLIFVSQRPAILVLVDGEPVLYPVAGTELTSAVNTNWSLFFQPKTGRYYLLDAGAEEAADGEAEPARGSWLTAPALDGPWTAASELPPDFLRLSEEWQDVRSHIPGRPLAAAEVPAVFAATRPAELIVIDGSPALTPIEGGRLMSVRNTDSDLFLFGGDGSYYYLVSGRWFRSKTLDGPWEFATGDLPADFAAIPPDHPRGSVLASVPGTPAAEEAVRLAKVPTQATVNRDEAKADVAYQGDPEFEPIEGTSMEYATNTPSDVIKVGDLYYLCLQGVWFFSTSATGPWQVADSVAEEIYTIPASSPVHHTTYVQVYDSGPDWVTVGYTAAYLGLMIAIFDDDPVVVYGTGWYHPPYVHYGPRPVYYPYHHSYGMAAWYNPATGSYGRGAAVYGPYGSAAAYQAYNPRTDTYRAGYRASNTYSSWGEGVVQRGNKWAHGGYYSDSRGTVAGVHTAQGRSAVAVRTDDGRRAFIGGEGNNVYAGKDGQVYRRGDRDWSRYDNKNQWSSVGTAERSAAAGTAASGARADQVRGQVSTQQRGQAQQRAQAQNRAAGAADSLRSAGAQGARAQAQNRAAGAAESLRSAGAQGARTRAQSAARQRASTWEGSSSRQDTVRQLDRDAKARLQGSQRAHNFKSQRGNAGQARSSGGRSGRSRGGRRGG